MTKTITLEDLVQKLYDAEQEMYKAQHAGTKRLPADTVIDEEKSVRWNREEVERRNSRIVQEQQAERQHNLLLASKAKTDIAAYIMKDGKMSYEQAKLVLEVADEKGHASNETAYYIREYIDFIDDFRSRA